MYLKTLLLRIQSFFTWAKRQWSRSSTELGNSADAALGGMAADTDDLSEAPHSGPSRSGPLRSDGPLTVRVIPEKSASQEISVKIETPEPVDGAVGFALDAPEPSAKEVAVAVPSENGDDTKNAIEAKTQSESVAQDAEPLEEANEGDLLGEEAGVVEAGDEASTQSTDEPIAESTEDLQDGAEDETEEEPFQIPDELIIEVGDEQMPLTTMLESLLFVAEKPTEPFQFAKVLELTVEQIEAGLLRLGELYKMDGRGLRVLERNGRYVLVTMPTAANTIETFLNLDLSMKLSGPALEALAIVAYRQPVTRQQIESVRGVDCGHVLRILLQHGLVEEVGRLETAGRPILYGVTDLFMQHFGLTSLGELPKLEITEADLLWASTEIAEEEGGENEDDVKAEKVEADDTSVVETEPANKKV